MIYLKILLALVAAFVMVGVGMYVFASSIVYMSTADPSALTAAVAMPWMLAGIVILCFGSAIPSVYAIELIERLSK